MLHNLKFICLIIAAYIINCYATSSRLVIVCGGEILFSEGATQDDPTVMGAYPLGILPLIKFLLEFINLNEMNAKKVVFADHYTVVGSLNSIKDYWDKLTTKHMSRNMVTSLKHGTIIAIIRTGITCKKIPL